MTTPIRQHLIDPEICIRCNTCEETCPIDAIIHNEDNYVVMADVCNGCGDCLSPCPTGAIDNWRFVLAPYPVEEQFGWDELPPQGEVASPVPDEEAGDDAAARLLAEAHAGAGGRVVAPASAAAPQVRLYKARAPLMATVQGNLRLTAEDRENDVRHIVLDLGGAHFPVLEGQSVGVLAPGATEPRLYSIASPRDGEKPGAGNIALTVKRVPGGLCSNYLCDLPKGARVALTGPFGATFLMPQDPEATVLMVCTGTGAAPFRGFTMRRGRAPGEAPGRLVMYFGARTPEELPYFGPLRKVPPEQLTQHLVFSRLPGQPKEYVQDRMRADAAALAPLLADARLHVFVCGLKGMEAGVDAALGEIAAGIGRDWAEMRAAMREEGRFHVETY